MFQRGTFAVIFQFQLGSNDLLDKELVSLNPLQLPHSRSVLDTLSMLPGQ